MLILYSYFLYYCIALSGFTIYLHLFFWFFHKMLDFSIYVFKLKNGRLHSSRWESGEAGRLSNYGLHCRVILLGPFLEDPKFNIIRSSGCKISKERIFQSPGWKVQF